VCAAAEGKAALLAGDTGVPELDVAPPDFNFAEDEGTGR
jgi:hypothetical protein